MSKTQPILPKLANSCNGTANNKCNTYKPPNQLAPRITIKSIGPIPNTNNNNINRQNPINHSHTTMNNHINNNSYQMNNNNNNINNNKYNAKCYSCYNRQACNAPFHLDRPCQYSQFTSNLPLKRKVIEIDDNDDLIVLRKKQAISNNNNNENNHNNDLNHLPTVKNAQNKTTMVNLSPEQSIHQKYINEFMKPLFTAFMTPSSKFFQVNCKFLIYNEISVIAKRVQKTNKDITAYNYIGLMLSQAYIMFSKNEDIRNEYLDMYRKYQDDLHAEISALKNSQSNNGTTSSSN